MDISFLVKGLFDDDPTVQQACTQLLLQKDSRATAEAIRPYLRSDLADYGKPRRARVASAYMRIVDILSMRVDEDTVEVLVHLALSEQPSVRERAMAALKKVAATPVGERTLLHLLEKDYEQKSILPKEQRAWSITSSPAWRCWLFGWQSGSRQCRWA